MKRFRCGDVVPGCTGTFHGLEDEVVRDALAHGLDAHGLTVTDDLYATVRAALTDA